MVKKKPETDEFAFGTAGGSSSEWIMQKPKKPSLDAFQWISQHQQELVQKVPSHPDFLKACGEDNSAPQKKFSEMLNSFLNPPDPFWNEFRTTLKQSFEIYSHRIGTSPEAQAEFMENTLFSSFSRILRLAHAKKLA